MVSRANEYFKLLQNWASERIKGAAPGSRAAAFDFSRVQDWQPNLVDKPVGGQLVEPGQWSRLLTQVLQCKMDRSLASSTAWLPACSLWLGSKPRMLVEFNH
jgi:hypothetical protein